MKESDILFSMYVISHRCNLKTISILLQFEVMLLPRDGEDGNQRMSFTFVYLINIIIITFKNSVEVGTVFYNFYFTSIIIIN